MADEQPPGYIHDRAPGSDATAVLLCGDARTVLADMPAQSVHCCITSPPYFGLRSYSGGPEEIGKEQTPQEYVAALRGVFGEVRRVLRDDGTFWCVLGDSYNAYNGNRGKSTSFQSATEHAVPQVPAGYGLTVKGLGNKQLLGIPWRVAFVLQDDGWILRQEVIWQKINAMPESVQDRCTRAHETVLMFTKRPRYYYDQDAISEAIVKGNAHSDYHRGKTGVAGLGRVSVLPRAQHPRRNKRSVWAVATAPFSARSLGIEDVDHYAAFPPELVRPMVRAGCPPAGVVLDPFCGSGTTGLVAVQEGRRFVGLDLNPAYVALARARIGTAQLPLPCAERITNAAG